MQICIDTSTHWGYNTLNNEGLRITLTKGSGQMKHPLMIRFLIHTTVKSRDVNGNCYNFSKITSTKTGKSLFVDNDS